MSLPPDDERCSRMDDGCRCLRPLGHHGPCDFPFTTWRDVLTARASRGDMKATRELLGPADRAVLDEALEIVRSRR